MTNLTAPQPSLLDLMRPPPILRPVDPDGEVVKGAAQETLIPPHPRMAWHLAEIELHPHEDLWMWSASSPVRGSYKVGVKWGKFAATRDDAAHHAAQELLHGIARIQASNCGPESRGISAAQMHQVEAWARAISDNPEAHHD